MNKLAYQMGWMAKRAFDLAGGASNLVSSAGGLLNKGMGQATQGYRNASNAVANVGSQLPATARALTSEIPKQIGSVTENARTNYIPAIGGFANSVGQAAQQGLGLTNTVSATRQASEQAAPGLGDARANAVGKGRQAGLSIKDLLHKLTEAASDLNNSAVHNNSAPEAYGNWPRPAR